MVLYCQTNPPTVKQYTGQTFTDEKQYNTVQYSKIQ